MLENIVRKSETYSHLGPRAEISNKRLPKDREAKPRRGFLWERSAFTNGHVYWGIYKATHMPGTGHACSEKN